MSTFEEDFGAKNTADLNEVWSHWFLYGESGVGKTTISSTFPSPVFIVPYNEQSVVTLRGLNYPYFLVVDMDKTRFDPRTGIGSMMGVVNHLEAMYNKYINSFPYDTAVVESVTHYCDLIQEQITNGSQKIMAQNDWGTLSSHIRTVQMRLRRLQMHSIFTALDKTESDADGKVLFGGPALPGQLATKFPSSCDCSGYCEILAGKDAPVFRVHFQKYRHFPARSRFRRMPKVVTNFNFSEIAHVLEPDDGRTDTAETADDNQ